jgi:dipeptidyl aminopeptidase/acylaminoacyl peptidase
VFDRHVAEVQAIYSSMAFGHEACASRRSQVHVVELLETRFGAFTVNSFDIARHRADRAIVAAGGLEPHQLHAWDRRTGELRALTSAPGGVLQGAISGDGRWVYYLADDTASEAGILVRVPFEGGVPLPVDPALAPGNILGWAAGRTTFAFTQLVDDRFEHRVAAGGEPGSRLVATSRTTAWVSNLADDEHTLVVVEYRPDGTRDTVLLDKGSGHEVGRATAPGVSTLAYTPSPLPGDSRFLAETDASGTARPFLWDGSTGSRTAIPSDDLEGEVRPLDWSPDGRLVLLLQIDQAELRLFVHDLSTGERRPLATPPGAVTGLPETFATLFASNDEVLTLWQDGWHPRAILAIPVDGGAASVVLGEANPAPGHPWRSVRFAASDGTPIQGWLAVPEGGRPGPAVIDIHGGPGVAQFDEFVPHLQAFVDEGFAVLSLNYRSSGTFGRAFRDATLGHPGDLEVDDIAAARDHLVSEGLADQARVIVEGWSWGGYLTLLSLGRRPDRWAGGICGVGIGDMAAQHDEAAEFISQMVATQHGGTPAEVPDRYRASSPITYAPAVAAPLLVIHGRDDIRCPAGQMQRYLDRMAELGKDVAVEWFEAGHQGGIASPALFLEQTRTMLAFAERVTGPGR